MQEVKFQCQCDYCRSCCGYKPGWFLPKEAEKVAEYMNLSLKDFFNKYLGVDWYENYGKEGKSVFVLAPATKTMRTGKLYSAKPTGECIFFVNELCKIHSIKPYECAVAGCKTKSKKRHPMMARIWNKTEYQNQIKELLGRTPKAKVWTMDNWDI